MSDEPNKLPQHLMDLINAQGHGLFVADIELKKCRQQLAEAMDTIRFLQKEYGEADTSTLTHDAVQLKLRLVERERDELKARLAHAEADAEQAIHNEAFMERQRIAEWLRLRTASRARGVLISLHSSQDIARCADAIENGEHTR